MNEFADAQDHLRKIRRGIQYVAGDRVLHKSVVDLLVKIDEELDAVECEINRVVRRYELRYPPRDDE